MIARIWHGCTEPDKAAAYETLLKTEIFHHIKNKEIPGFIDIQLLRNEMATETEFVTIMRFENIESVKQFAGENYTQAVVPETAQQLLKRYDKVSQHYEIKEYLAAVKK
ncbi:MAG: antibiotic biosynthesis monooxygenase [Ferruginibacter sp.]